MTRAFLQIESVRLVRGQRQILDGVSFGIGRGELVVINGPSGSGKTTILRAIAALEVFQDGQIVVDDVILRSGAPAEAATLRALRRKVGMVFQFHHLFEHLSALDNVCLAPVHVLGVARPQAERRAHQLFAAFGVEHRAEAMPRHLSGGEAQRVAIARALAVDPPVLLMDEPMASLDPARRTELGALLKRLTAAGRILIVTSHDEVFASQFATRIVSIEGGKVR